MTLEHHFYNYLCAMRRCYISSQWYRNTTYYMGERPPIIKDDGTIDNEPVSDHAYVKAQIDDMRAKLMQLTYYCPECLNTRSHLWTFLGVKKPYLSLVCDKCGAFLDQYGQPYNATEQEFEEYSNRFIMTAHTSNMKAQLVCIMDQVELLKRNIEDLQNTLRCL